jgi:hypothetical protein
MKPWLYRLSLTLGLFWRAMVSAAQPIVVLETNWPEAQVYADSFLLGRAGLRSFILPPGTQILRLVPPEGDTWSIPAQQVALPQPLPDTLWLRLPFLYYYRLETLPSGARIYRGLPSQARLLGETPFTGAFEEPLQDTLYFVHACYALAMIRPTAHVWNHHRLVLQPVDSPKEVTMWTPALPRRHGLTYLALGVAVAATAVSIHYKFQADRLYARYEQTGDPALRPRIRELDLRAGVALGVAQIGLGLAAFRLIFQ